MKVLLVNGSPRPEGCTRTALDEVAKGLRTEKIGCELFQIGPKPIGGCIACRACAGTGRCATSEPVNRFLEAAETADAFVFGSPVHYAAASGTITGFLDRAFYADALSGRGVFHHKPGAAVVSGRRAGTTTALDQLHKYFTISQMPVVSSCYWTMVHGSTPDEVRQDEEGLQVMRVLGRNLAWMLRCLEAGRRDGIVPPILGEARARTDFVR